MATGSNVIAALRGGASAAPMAAMTPQAAGVSFFDPMAQTATPAAAPITLPSTINALRRNNTYALDNPTMLTMPAGVVGGNAPKPVVKKAATTSASAAPATTSTAPAAAPATTAQAATPNPFAGGQALNAQYKDLVKGELNFDLPDLSPYTGKYLEGYRGELATPESRAGLINAMQTAQAQEAAGGYYQPGDLTPVIGSAGRQSNSEDWWSNNYNSVFGDGNSYFLPDTSEVTFIPQEVLGAFRKTGETDDQVHSRLYYGNRFLGAGGGRGPNANAEQSIRQLLNPTAADNPYNLIRENAGNLVSFDVGRGDLTYDQGYATSRLLEAKDDYDMWNRTLDQYKEDAFKLQNELETGTFYDPRSTYTPEGLAQLRADKQASLERLNAQIAAGNPSQRFYDDIMAGAKTIDPAMYKQLSSAALLRAAGLGG